VGEIYKLKCKSCGKTLAEADFKGIIKKKCPKCTEMNIYIKQPSGKIYEFIEK
jgi:phage FluMu protein Com